MLIIKKKLDRVTKSPLAPETPVFSVAAELVY